MQMTQRTTLLLKMGWPWKVWLLFTKSGSRIGKMRSKEIRGSWSCRAALIPLRLIIRKALYQRERYQKVSINKNRFKKINRCPTQLMTSSFRKWLIRAVNYNRMYSRTILLSENNSNNTRHKITLSLKATSKIIFKIGTQIHEHKAYPQDPVR